MISILLPVYNSSPHLEMPLDSILGQSETSWELIAVDDYSTDDSWKILQRYAFAGRPHPTKLRNTGGKGIIPALRLALKYSRAATLPEWTRRPHGG